MEIFYRFFSFFTQNGNVDIFNYKIKPKFRLKQKQKNCFLFIFDKKQLLMSKLFLLKIIIFHTLL